MNDMRLPIVALLLVQSLAASAQPFVGDEVLSDALRPSNAVIHVATPAAAMAQDLRGVAITSTVLNAAGVNALYVARLDDGGRIVTPATEIGLAGTAGEVEAYWPSIAASPDGRGFTLAWVELSRVPLTDSVSAVYCQLDADLKPSVRRVLTTMQATEITAPAIVRSGMSTWISFAGSVWEIHADGSLGRPPLDAGMPVSDMVATTEYPQVVSVQGVSGNFECMSAPGCGVTTGLFKVCYERCRIYQNLALRFVSLNTGSATRTSTFKSASRPAIQSDGRDVLVVWKNGDQAGPCPVTAVRLSATATSFDGVFEDLQGGQDIGTFGADTVATRPDIATDGERYVVVWSTKKLNGDHDIVGASIDREGQVTPLSIATTEAEERDPSVLMTAPGNFLVSYEKLSNNERRLATRSLKFNRRRRAVH